jgi:hypothetical protein
MFLQYLELQGVRHDFGPGALPALALLIAESSSSDKETMVRITINALSNREAIARCEDDRLEANSSCKSSISAPDQIKKKNVKFSP